MTAKEFLLQGEVGFTGDYTPKEVMQLMKLFAEHHAVRIVKALSQTEMEYQRNKVLIDEIKLQ